MKTSPSLRTFAAMLMASGGILLGSAQAQEEAPAQAPATAPAQEEAPVPAQEEAPAPAQEEAQAPAAGRPGPAGHRGRMGQHGGMMSMMGQCMRYCQAVSSDASEERLEKLRAVRESNDPAVLRAALDQVIKNLEANREKMEACLEMMGDQGEMMQGGQDAGRPPKE